MLPSISLFQGLDLYVRSIQNRAQKLNARASSYDDEDAVSTKLELMACGISSCPVMLGL
jgi:hypothetical protein